MSADQTLYDVFISYRETQTILMRLATADPANAGWQRDLGVSHNNVGNVLLAQGELAGALQAYGDALAVATRLVAADPSNADWQRDLTVGHIKLGDVLLVQRDLTGALQAYRRSLPMAERLAVADPSNAGWQRDLFVSYFKTAEIAEENGADDALDLFRKAYKQLADMQARGILLPADEEHLTFLRQKARAE